MNEFYKKFKDKFTEDGEIEFYLKIERMKKDAKNVSSPAIKKSLEENISSMISSYENMKKYYNQCLEYEEKIKMERKKSKELAPKIFKAKMDFIKNKGYMFKSESDEKFGLSKN